MTNPDRLYTLKVHRIAALRARKIKATEDWNGYKED